MLELFITPRFGDIDGLRHVNNTCVPGWFEQARNPLYQIFNPDLNFETWNLILVRIEVDYISQMYYHKDVQIKTFISRIGRSSFEVYQEGWQNESLCVKGKAVIVYFDFKTQKSIAIPDPFKELLGVHAAFEKAEL